MTPARRREPGSRLTAQLIALIVPMGLDTFGVALALGAAGLAGRHRLAVPMLFAAFETGMPLIGAALGAPLGHAVGGVADYLAAGLVGGLGVYMLLSGEQIEEDEERLLSMTRRGAAGMLALGVSISLDELAIGFGAGLLRLPILLLAIVVGAQAFLVTQVGIRLGSRLGEAVPELAERLAGVALLLLAAVLLVERVA